MLLTDWNMEDALRVRTEETREEIFDLLEKGISLSELKRMFMTSNHNQKARQCN